MEVGYLANQIEQEPNGWILVSIALHVTSRRILVSNSPPFFGASGSSETVRYGTISTSQQQSQFNKLSNTFLSGNKLAFTEPALSLPTSINTTRHDRNLPMGALSATLMQHFSSNNYVSELVFVWKITMAHFSKLKTWQHRTPNPIEAKAWGLIQSLTSLKDLNYQNIDFELDNKVVVDGFDNLSHGLSDFNLILNKCNLLFFFFPTQQWDL